MQEKIMSFEGKFKGAFYLALVDNHLYIVVYNSDDSIKIPTNNQITAEDLSPVIELLSIPKVFIEQLHLASYKYKADTTKIEDWLAKARYCIIFTYFLCSKYHYITKKWFSYKPYQAVFGGLHPIT